tara:strand:- start:791 stop:1270 length:480 start_codon:yes stop_codon:yes gene_type:complete
VVIILDDVIGESDFQKDALDILKDGNIEETWYNLNDQHHFDNFCTQFINVANQYLDLTSCIGYEFWTQNNTKPVDWHYDKDERLSKDNVFSFPLCSIVYYLVVENLKGGQLLIEDDIITPRTDRMVIFSPGKLHTVQSFEGNRVSLLINPWDRDINTFT